MKKFIDVIVNIVDLTIVDITIVVVTIIDVFIFDVPTVGPKISSDL